jgi:hypothetical protein
LTEGDEESETRITGLMTETERSFWRPVVSITAAAVLTGALWTLVPDRLSISTGVVSSLIFNGLDVLRYDYAYYFIAFLFPLIAIGLLWLLARKGPLRYQGGDRPALWPLTTVTELGVGEATPSFDKPRAEDSSGRPDSSELHPASTDAGADQRPAGFTLIGAIWAAARIGLPMTTIVIELVIARSPSLPHGRAFQAGAAGTYVVVVALLALGFRAIDRRGAHADRAIAPAFPLSLARANSLAAIVVVPLLYLISRSTTVGIGSEARLVHYPWLPLWLVGLLTLAALLVWFRRDRRSETPDDLLGLEAGMLTWVVGPVLLFLVVAAFPGALGPFQAFDDAHFLAGPQLVFQHGLFPWKDIYLLHGLLADLLDGKIGMILFGNTRWGANAGLSLLVNPANWIVLYLFAAYFCRKNRLLLVGLTVAMACGLVQGNSLRFLLFPIFLITFDAVLRRPTWRRCWLFMATLVVGIILSPEEALFAPCLLVPLVVFEAAGRSRGQSISTSLPRTWRCAIAGAALSVAWFALLAGTGSLLAFFDYFRVFSSGYGLEGRVPTQWDLATQLMLTFAWAIPVVLWLATVWRVVRKLRLRQAWAVTDWVMVAAAAMSAIYYPQALDRADAAHVYQSFWVSVPLLILWSVEVLTVADRAIRSALRRLPTTGPTLRMVGLPQSRHLASFAAVVAIVIGTAGQAQTIPFVVGQVAPDFHPTVPLGASSALPRLGYTVPGSVDTVQIRQLGAMLSRYAGPTAPVFDYANEPGIVYYLLNRIPGTRYTHVDEAQTPAAQQQVVAELQKSRPPVVVFSNTTFGLLSYDGIPQALRSYAVSTYLYAHYRPLLDARGQLLLLRDDLYASAPPVPPGFRTTDLYFDTSSCTFGDIPDYLALPANIATLPHVRVPVTLGTTRLTTTVTGWAVDTAAKAPAIRILAVADGHVVASAAPSLARPDVAESLHDPAARQSGFTMAIPVSRQERPELFALNADGSVSPLPPTPGAESKLLGRTPLTTVVTQDGVVHQVVGGGALSGIDVATRALNTLITLHLPGNVTSTSYYWLELNGSHPLGTSSFALTDRLGAPPGHSIEFNTLPRVGRHVYVGAGSCLQWHGYGGNHQLYLQSTGSRPASDFSVTLVK